MIQACRRATIATGAASRLSSSSPTPIPRKGTTWQAMLSVHSRPCLRRYAASTSGRHETADSSGSRAADAKGSAPGYGPAHDHELGVERKLAHLGGATLALVHNRDEALVELPPEGLDSRLVRRLIAGRPLRER